MKEILRNEKEVLRTGWLDHGKSLSEDKSILTNDERMKMAMIIGRDRGKREYRRLEELTNEQLCRKFQEGNQEALEELFNKNIGLVKKQAYKYLNYYGNKLSFEELVQIGFLGLLNGAIRYDESKGTKFTTYLVFWVKQNMLRDIMNIGFTVRIPSYIFDKQNKILKLKSKNPEKYYDSILKELKIDKDEVKNLNVIFNNACNISSSDENIKGDTSLRLVDVIGDKKRSVELEVIAKEGIKKVEKVVGGLKEREKIILEHRYGIGGKVIKTLKQLGEELGLSRERVRQIEKQTLKKLKDCKELREIYFS